MHTTSSLLLALDLTPASDVLLHRVGWLARGGRIQRLQLVHAVDTRILDGITNPGSSIRQDLETRACEAAELALAGLAERFRSLGVAEVRVEVRSGRPEVELAGAVEAAEPDLVVAGAGNRLWRQAMLGSTARRLLHRLSRPLWLIRDGHDRPYASYLLACDLSPAAVAAARLTAELWPGLKGHALLVLEHFADRIAGNAQTGAGGSDDQRAEALRLAAANLDAFVHEHFAWHMDTSVVEGHPAASILDALTAQQADLLVLGRRSRATTDKTLGSMAETVVNLVECDLLVVPA